MNLVSSVQLRYTIIPWFNTPRQILNNF